MAQCRSVGRWRRGVLQYAPTVALLMLLAGPATAQEVRLHVLADSVVVGERFGVAVAVEHGAAVEVVFPAPPAGAGARDARPLEAGDAELLALRRLPPRREGSLRVDSAVYEAAAFALDAARVGPVAVRLVTGGDTTVVASPVATVGVRSLVPEDAEGIHGPEPPAAFPRPLWPWLLAALLLAAAVGALVAWLRHKHRPVPAVPLTPIEAARQRLGTLADQPEAAKAHFVGVSEATRGYLRHALGLPALRLTTGELLALLRERPGPAPPESLEAIAEVLRQADLVKFAGAAPTPEARAGAARRALAAVEVIELALHPPEPEPAEAAA